MTKLSVSSIAGTPVAVATGEASTRAATDSAAAAAVDAATAPSAAATRAAAEEANQALRERSSELAFEFDDALDRIVVKLVDSSTHEVIRQIPSEEMLRIARWLKQETQAGVLLRTDA